MLSSLIKAISLVSCATSLLSLHIAISIMPVYRRRKIVCAFAKPEPPAAPRGRKLCKDMSEREKYVADLQSTWRSAQKELKPAWDAALKSWKGPETFTWPVGTLVRVDIFPRNCSSLMFLYVYSIGNVQERRYLEIVFLVTHILTMIYSQVPIRTNGTRHHDPAS